MHNFDEIYETAKLYKDVIIQYAPRESNHGQKSIHDGGYKSDEI